ncbi:MAG: hypothetical protein HUJ72_09250 [Blautia sp.]|nr:hypothetical protein [Blautia sp.]
MREAFPEFVYHPPMSVLKALYPENMTAQEIATGLTTLAEGFDLYDIRDQADTPLRFHEEVETKLASGRGMEYAPFLNDVIAESPSLRFQAEILLQRIRAFRPEPEKQAAIAAGEQETQNMSTGNLAEHSANNETAKSGVPQSAETGTESQKEATHRITKSDTAKAMSSKRNPEQKSEKKPSIHKRLKEKKEIVEKRPGKENPQKGVELS